MKENKNTTNNNTTAINTDAVDEGQKIKLRQYSASICDVFENLLDKHGIKIPDEDRTGDESEACLYGSVYSEVEDSVTEILDSLATEICDRIAGNIIDAVFPETDKTDY